MKFTSFIIPSAFAAFSSLAFAGGEYNHKQEDESASIKKTNPDAYTFEQFDQNNNGQLEESEVMNVNQGRNLDGTTFETIDNNSDGVVSRSEWQEFADEEKS